MRLRGPRTTWAPDGLAGGVPRSRPGETPPSRKRGGAGAPLANAMLAHLPLAVAVVDADSRLVFWNEQAAVLFGAPPLMAADAPALADILAGVANLAQPQRDRITAFATTHIAA